MATACIVSDDGGKNWKNIGLKKSGNIGRIAIDPRDSKVVYVAAEGPLWGPGGDRGLFKTTDGGKSWKNVLTISENTGVVDVAIDPSNPDTVYAAAYQRRRHVFTMIDGGPESAIYKSTDAGATWNKLKSGLPTEDLGRIGLAISPADPNVVYATVEAANGKGGIFRSKDKGATWEKRNDFDSTAFYYSQIVADPKNVDRIYVMNAAMNAFPTTVARPAQDERGQPPRRQPCASGSTRTIPITTCWAPTEACTRATIAATTGHSRPTFRRCSSMTSRSTTRRPSTTSAAERRTTSPGAVLRARRNINGIMNSDWFVTTGGDGFRSQVDPDDPNTVYAESQYGVLVRYDKRTGEQILIQPQEGQRSAAPALELGFASHRVSASRTRVFTSAETFCFAATTGAIAGRPISPDLTRQLDRNKLPVMGKVWGPDAVAKNQSTSFYGNIVSLAESPQKEGLLYVGTDDGLIQVTQDGGATWTKYEKFPGVPEMTYVSRLAASKHDINTVYAAFDNHKNEDFKPYLLKSTDAGKTWTSIAGDLPENGPVLAFAEDPVNPNLLFAGTEFGAFFTVNGGQKWIQMKGGLPTIAVRDMIVHPREGDLVLATFGRGFYILDDITALRQIRPDKLQQNATLFPAKEACCTSSGCRLAGQRRAFRAMLSIPLTIRRTERCSPIT